MTGSDVIKPEVCLFFSFQCCLGPHFDQMMGMGYDFHQELIGYDSDGVPDYL